MWGHLTTSKHSWGSILFSIYLFLTRPDISFAVNKVCQFMHNHTNIHWKAINRILCYLKFSVNHGLFIQPSSSFHLFVYSDCLTPIFQGLSYGNSLISNKWVWPQIGQASNFRLIRCLYEQQIKHLSFTYVLAWYNIQLIVVCIYSQDIKNKNHEINLIESCQIHTRNLSFLWTNIYYLLFITFKSNKYSLWQ